MQAIVKAIPVVYFFATCPKHQCKVEVQIEPVKDYGKMVPIGGNVTMLNCREGGPPEIADCHYDWELSISGWQEVRVTE